MIIKSQLEILEMKNTMSERKTSLDNLNTMLEIKEESVTWRSLNQNYAMWRTKGKMVEKKESQWLVELYQKSKYIWSCRRR